MHDVVLSVCLSVEHSITYPMPCVRVCLSVEHACGKDLAGEHK
jgi:hypothetical protein